VGVNDTFVLCRRAAKNTMQVPNHDDVQDKSGKKLSDRQTKPYPAN